MCPGSTTLTEGSSSADDCIVPEANQSFECVVGKPCSISNFSGTGLVNNHSLMVKAQLCMPDYGGGLYGGYGGSYGGSGGSYGTGTGSYGTGTGSFGSGTRTRTFLLVVRLDI